MTTNLNWNKNLYRNQIKIFQGFQKHSSLTGNLLNTKVIGSFKENKYIFKRNNSNDISIVDLRTDEEVVTIKINKLVNKSVINLKGKNYTFSYENFFKSSWTIKQDYKDLIKYKSNFNRGRINSETDDELLILTGMYLSNQFWKTGVSIVVFSILINLIIQIFLLLNK